MPDVVAPTPPVLVSVPRVELGAVGRWNISNMQGWEPSPGDFASAVAALGCPAVRRPVLKLGHSGNPGEGDPAIGYIDNMAVTGDGQVLVGDFAGIPAWLAAEDDAGNSVLASAYPDRSGEWEHDHVCQLGHTHPFVLHAVALLGVVRPGIGTLESLHDLYTIAPAQEPLMPAASQPSAAGTVSAAATTDDVRRAYYTGPGSNWDLYIREMYVDPPELIVQNDADASLTRVAYVIDADGAVTFAGPQPVKVTYVAARTTAGPPVVAYASRAESRPGPKPAPPAPPPASGPPAQNGGGMPADPAKIREALGLPASASDTDVGAAFAAAGLTAPAPPAAANPATTEPAEPAAATDTALPIKVPAAAAGAGSDAILLDPAQLKALQAQAVRGDEAYRRMKEAECEQVLDAAIKAGKFPPARREHWQRLWAADPDGTKATIGQLAAGVIPMTAAGYAGVGDETGDDLLYKQIYGAVG